MCGFYLNELLVNLLARDDPHEKLFDDYRSALQRLAAGTDHAATLRCFEKHLLQEMGYALVLEHEAGSGRAVRAELCYRYAVEGGVMPNDGEDQSGALLQGKTLLDMARDEYSDPVTALQSKQLMRMLLNHYLGGKRLHTRELIKDFQRNMNESS